MRVSVVIPCFNTEAYLAEAVASVLAQSRPVKEIIVVDDGSTDSSGDIGRRFGDPVSVRVQDHQGIGAARNTGVMAATGDLIGFLDADDIWPTDSLAARLAALEAQSTLDGVYGLTEQFISPDLGPAEAQGYLCPDGYSRGRIAGAMLIRRRTFDTIGMFDASLALGEFVDWIARLTDAQAAIQDVDKLVLRRRIHANNSVTRYRAQRGDYVRLIKASLDRRASLNAGRSS